MPATAFNATAAAAAAILVHSIVPIDSDVGCNSGLSGLLLSSGYQVKPSRDRATHTNHRKLTVTSLSTDPALTLSFDAKVTVLSGPFSAVHPGTAFDPTLITQYFSGVSHGFPISASNWFEHMTPSFGAPAGDLYTTQFELKLWAPAYVTGGAYVYA